MSNIVQSLFGLHNRVFELVERSLANWLPGLAARAVFSSVLLVFFWQSAATKLDGGLFSPSAGAYAQIFPKTLEALDYDTDRMSAFHSLIVLAGTYAEFILPLLILVGLMTRLASAGMIGFITVMSIVDIYGHGLDEKSIGGLFDRFQDSVIADQRLLWVFPLVYLVIKGAGMISVDALLKKILPYSSNKAVASHS
ncbi:DoxX family protein [Sneathiella sp.]|uniref:DoxX family protein n=1 Tax=Sneathiella sp. TaxID=1964365 RepID=UPI0039E5B014